ncbi:cytochrome P450 9e2-like [Odontomachus brunneus]|uniref:cytochrome P450 9e2-like n=1 Tax=Odontomachus brunneus TaxID=486640 RepID=UPI0013F261F1|nr:cytochrome P450 9e2-like [Odontomachus brunneus]
MFFSSIISLEITMVTTILLLAVLTACAYLYKIMKSNMMHFEKLNVPHEKPFILLGNMAPVFFRRLSITETIAKLYERFSNTKYFGIYNFMTPTLVIRDPDLINTITIKNFDSFCDHRSFVNNDVDRLVGKNLFSLKGDHWREMRKLLSPAFTSSKLKTMFHLMCQCADNFSTHMANNSKVGMTINVKEEMCKYANDVVATCAFGVSLNSFKDPNNEFYRLGREAMNFDSNLGLKFMLNISFPKIVKMFNVRMFSEKVENFFKNLVSNVVKVRDEEGISRPDMIQLMMETRGQSTGPMFDIDEMTAQAFIFFLGGFDSVSTAMCFLVHEVAMNSDVQHKLRTEIEEVLRKNDGKPTYEAINSMKYLNAVLNETLRLYPLAAFLDRVCVKEFELPPATPDGKPTTVKVGDCIWFSSYSVHHDSNYYSEPKKFNPDRFLDDNLDNSVYFPFGIGPRLCIGNRFALLEMKIMLFYMLWRCDLEPDVKMKIPLVLSKKIPIMMAEGGFWLKLRARRETCSLLQ